MTIEQTPQLVEEQYPYPFQGQSSQASSLLGQQGQHVPAHAGNGGSGSFLNGMQSQFKGGWQLFRGLADEFKKMLGVEGVRFLNEDGSLQLRVIRPFQPAVPLLDLLALMPAQPPATAVLGLAEDGAPVTHTFSANQKPNILICGQADAGKSVLLRTIAASLAISSKQADVQLLAINPVSVDRQRHQAQETALRPLSYLPHMLADIAMRQTEITELLFFLVRELNYRLEHTFANPRIILLVDQAATVMEHGGRTVVEAFQRLAQQGPEVGINLVLSTRRPEAAVFDAQLMPHLQTRFTGRLDMGKATEEKAQAADIEATTLLGEGDFLAAGGSGSVRFQAAYIDDNEIQTALLRHYWRRPILLAVPLNGDAKLERKRVQKPAFEQQFSFVDNLLAVN